MPRVPVSTEHAEAMIPLLREVYGNTVCAEGSPYKTEEVTPEVVYTNPRGGKQGIQDGLLRWALVEMIEGTEEVIDEGDTICEDKLRDRAIGRLLRGLHDLAEMICTLAGGECPTYENLQSILVPLEPWAQRLAYRWWGGHGTNDTKAVFNYREKEVLQFVYPFEFEDEGNWEVCEGGWHLVPDNPLLTLEMLDGFGSCVECADVVTDLDDQDRCSNCR